MHYVTVPPPVLLGARNDLNDLTKYERLTADVRVWLETGMFKAGEPVPSITDLAADQGWARGTCARALRRLEDEGLLRRQPGLGYYVTGAPTAPDQP